MKRIAFLLATLVLNGCASIVSSVTDTLADDLSRAILNNDDLATVKEGVPAFLIVLDALLASSPDNPNLLTAAARLNASYATGFVVDQARQTRLTNKSMELSQRAACRLIAWTCDARKMPFEELETRLLSSKLTDVPAMYAYASVFETLLPPAMGGRPEVGRRYFERAIEISGGRYLMAKVLYAEKYARLVFDRELHDTLLTEVSVADPYDEALTLINLVAQDQAAALLESADEYF